MPTGGGGGGGGGLSSVTTDATLTGVGTGGSPLSVAAPYNHAAPGTLGGTTSSTGQFTQVAVGASPPTLPGTTGDVAIAGSLAMGGATPPATAGDVIVARGNSGAVGVITMGTIVAAGQIVGQLDSASNSSIKVFNNTCGNVYFQLRNSLLFSNLPAASATFEGCLASITDSTVNTWGTTITGGGANHVLAYCDGAAWKVAGI